VRSGEKNSNIEVRGLYLKRKYFTAGEYNRGGHFYVEASFRLNGSFEKPDLT
jgi:hypothetical protein